MTTRRLVPYMRVLELLVDLNRLLQPALLPL